VSPALRRVQASGRRAEYMPRSRRGPPEPEGEKLGRIMTGLSSNQRGKARNACGGAAGSVARVSVSRGEASGSWPARARAPGYFLECREMDARGMRKGKWLPGRAGI
jgi:hypothetical protein